MVAFLIDIALFAWTRHQFKRLDVGARTITGPGKFKFHNPFQFPPSLLLLPCSFILILILSDYTHVLISHLIVTWPLTCKFIFVLGFWITFAAFIILFIGGLSTCLGRIKDRRASRHVKDLAAVEAARAKEAEAAVHNHADEKSEKVEDDAAQPGSTPGWARKFKFGKKSQA